MAVEEKSEVEEVIAAEVETAIGDSPAAAEVPITQAVKWFEVLEVPEVGFKAFCRLPNDFQHRDIREKAMAAKARRTRALKDQGTDAYEVLEGSLEEILAGEDPQGVMVAEITAKAFYEERGEAEADVREGEDYEHFSQDQERFRELIAVEPEDRSEDEWSTLVKHLAAYSKAVDDRMEELMQPRIEALKKLDLDVLVGKVRDQRIANDSGRVFMETYSFWQMYAGTLKIPEGFDPENITKETTPRQRYFDSERALREEADPLLVSRLTETFEALENGLNSLASGNS